MGLAPRPIESTPEEVGEKIDEQLSYNPRLIKQITETYRSDIDPGAEAELAEQTIYPLWREFLKAYVDYRGSPDDHADPIVQQTFLDFGDLDCDFTTWWRDEGRELFIETGQIPIITVESIDEEWRGEDDYPKHITLRIPLTVPRQNVLTQFNDILDQCHMGSSLYRHRHSTAKYKLHPRSKYIRPNFERMLRVWKLANELRDRQPEAQQEPWWKIGQLANLAPGVDPNVDTPARTREESRQHLARVASDLYEKAEAVMQNAIRGNFPKADAE